MLPEVMPRGRGSMHEAEDLMPSAIGRLFDGDAVRAGSLPAPCRVRIPLRDAMSY